MSEPISAEQIRTAVRTMREREFQPDPWTTIPTHALLEALEERYGAGYAAGLGAAREAITAMYDEHDRTCEQQGCEGPDREYALAAIDALLAKPDSQRVSENPDE